MPETPVIAGDPPKRPLALILPRPFVPSPRLMEKRDCIIVSDESASGGEANIQGENHCSEPMQPTSPIKDGGKIIEEPRIGMDFSSDESALKFYSNYGGELGFRVRKQHLKKSKAGLVTRRRFCCSKEGQRKMDKRRINALYRQPVSRIGCMAHMTCLLQKNGKYRIVSFDPNHNHELGTEALKKRSKLPISITNGQKSQVAVTNMSTVPINSTIDQSSHSYIHGKQKRAMEKEDARAVMQYFQKMQLENPSYFYSMQLDVDNMITNIFWADLRSVSDYSHFGDVVCFDTTYRTNDCDRPFAQIIGVNHHRQIVVFGAALLYDESVDSYKWLFETFLGAMYGKPPKTVLTDRSVAMAKAITAVFPKTHHMLCLWHIYLSAVKNLSHLFNGSNQFLHDLNECIYAHEGEDEWLSSWNNMLEKYNLKENVWLKALFEEKEKWASVYGRHIFSADMKSTQRSEDMSNMLREFLKLKHNILRFFEHYERILADRRYEEQIADFKMMQSSSALSASVEMLRHAAKVYTPVVFELFQKEYMDILDCSIYKVCKFGTTYEYKVTYAGKCKEHVVRFEASTYEVVCSCKKFNFVGILCAHALKVLDKKNVKNIPPQYIMVRWTRDAKVRNEIQDNFKDSNGHRYGHLFRKFCEIASFASEHEKLASYAHECSVDLLKNLHEMKKRIWTPEIHMDNGSQVSFPTHLATITMQEKFGSATCWQFNSPFIQAIQVSSTPCSSLPPSKEKGQEFGHRAP